MATLASPKPLSGPKPAQRLAVIVAAVLVALASYRLANSSGGIQAITAVFGLLGAVLVARRPVLGIVIYLTTFLFTYPAWLRGIGNFTINNMLGLMMLPLMMYGMLREGNVWLLKWRPMVLLAAIVGIMIVSSWFYVPSGDIGSIPETQRIETSARSQGPALISTRDASAKFLTRFVFLTFFVFFVRTPRDAKIAAGTIIACLLMTYFSVSTGEGQFGWGTGRLRVLGSGGLGVYAGRNPNKLAYFALMCLTILWYSRRSIKNSLLYPIWFGVTALTAAMIPMTGSRSGLLNLLVFIAVLLMEGKFDFRKIFGLAMVTIFVILQLGFDVSVVDLVFPQETAQRLTRFDVRAEALASGLEAQGSAEGRIRTAQSAFRIFALHPIAGVGIGNFEMERSVTDPFGVIGPPHNSYLWALAEGGLITFGLYMMLFVWCFRQIRDIEWEYEARYGPVGLGWLVSAMRTALIGFMFFSFFGDMWHHIMFYILMGLVLSVIRMHQVYAETGQVPEAFRLGKAIERPTM
jgi:O-antigen ligase